MSQEPAATVPAPEPAPDAGWEDVIDPAADAPAPSPDEPYLPAHVAGGESAPRTFEVYNPDLSYDPPPAVVRAPSMPASVIAPGVLWMFGSALYGLFGAASLLVIALDPDMTGIGLTVGLLFLAIMIGGLLIGVNMLRGKAWARIAMTAMTGLTALSSCGALMSTSQNPDPIAVLFGVALPLATLIPLWLPASSKFFTDSARAESVKQRPPEPMR